jgi:hypothetical protein
MVSTEEIIKAINELPEDVAPRDLVRMHQALVNVARRRAEEDSHKDMDNCPDCNGGGKLVRDGFQSADTPCPRCRGDGKYHPHSSDR